MKSIFIQVFIVVSIVLGYFFIDFNSIINYFEPKKEFITQDISCDLHKSACEITFKNQKVSLEVFPKEIPLMENLRFRIKSDKNLDEESLVLKIYATNMFMGYFNLKFEKVAENIYESMSMLPTCPVGNMKWNADLELKDTNLRFLFQTTR